jgi:hypothetical protein
MSRWKTGRSIGIAQAVAAAIIVISGVVIGPVAVGAGAATSPSQAEATAHLLALADMPAGWKVEKNTVGLNSIFPDAALMAACTGESSKVLALQPPQGDTPIFDNKDDQFEVQYSDYVFASAADAAATFGAVGNAKTPSCLAAFANGPGKSQMVGPLDKGDSAGTLTVSATDPADYGSATAGFVITIPLTVEKTKVSIHSAMVFDLHGPLLEQFTFTSYGEPFPVSLSTQLVALQAGRSAALTGTTGTSASSTTTLPAVAIQPDPSTTPGPEGIPIPIGPELAGLATAGTGATIDGLQCQTSEQTVSHEHTHVTIFVNGKAQAIPDGIGIPDPGAAQTADGPFVQTGTCFYWLHTHAKDGIIHIESPRASLHFTLGEFFDVWGQPLSTTQVGPAMGTVSAFLNGKPYPGNPRTIPLGDHSQIQLNVGAPAVQPVHITKWGGL